MMRKIWKMKRWKMRKLSRARYANPCFAGHPSLTSLLQARIKREQVAANKTVDGRIDDSDDEDEQHLTGEGKRMKRALGKMDQAYDSDDDDRKNPYASSVGISWPSLFSHAEANGARV